MSKKSPKLNYNSCLENDPLDFENALNIIREEIPQYEPIVTPVLQVIHNMPEFSPEISCKDSKDYLKKWAGQFKDGYEGRASQCIGTPMKTVHDRILDVFINAGLTEDLEQHKFAVTSHRFLMNYENKVGSFLENYLAEKLGPYGYYCAWGSTIKFIDFVSADGSLLQIKNSDNSENSSSNKVRVGTEIKKWFRRYSKTGKYNWPKLNALIGISNEEDKLSEEGFEEFIYQSIKSNPKIIYIEQVDGNEVAVVQEEKPSMF